jgi:hypothetical protein
MRIFVSMILFGMTVQSVTAQWTQGTGVVTLTNGTDNVGMGISPATGVKLHLNGTIRGNGPGGSLRVSTPTGYLDVGSMNTAWAHFQTDLPAFHFNKPFTVAGKITPDGLTVGRYGAAILGDTNPYVLHTTDAEAHELLVFGSNVATLHLRVLDGDLRIGLNHSPSTTLYNSGAASFGGAVTVMGNQIRFSEDRGLDYTPAADALFYNGYDNGQVVKLGDQSGNGWFMGTLGIGIQSTGSDKLAVNGTIHAKEVRVDMLGWADYVFNDDYKLPPLSEVRTYIKEHRHLPDVPSEEEVLANGQNLGEMNAVLLRKIEELTLYQIEADKQLNNLRAVVEELKKDISNLNK